MAEYKLLNNGLKMPMVGLGVYNISERETQRVVEDAISLGYRSIDTAAMYNNERGVGDAVARRTLCARYVQSHWCIELLSQHLSEDCG